MKVFYVEFLYPGIITSESSEKRLDSEHDTFEIPKSAFGYGKFWREESNVNGETLIGPRHMVGGWTFFGTKKTLDEIPDTPENRILRTNMKNNNIKAVVRTRFGQAIPIGEKDVVHG